MRIRSLLLAASLVPAALLSVAAAPEGCSVLDAGDAATADDDVLACESAAYLACNKAVGEGPTAKLHDPISTVDLVFDAPAESFTAGAGCGEVEVAGLSGTAMNNIYDLNVAGTLIGNVDSVTIELHSIYAAAQRAGGTVDLDVRFDIGGVAPNGTVDNVASGTGTVTKTPKPIRFSVDPVTSSTGVSESFTVTVTDLHERFPQLSKTGDGSANYLPFNMTVNVVPTTYAGPWVWGASEIPAGVTLNKGGDLGTVISATDLIG